MTSISIDYINGILQTYAHLNMPNSNLSYWYQLEFSEKKYSELLFLKQYLSLPEECNLLKTEVSEIDFKKKIFEWFFENGELKQINLNERRKNNEVDSFYKSLDLLIGIREIIKIEEDPKNETFYELGIFYNYFFLNNGSSMYMLMLRYDD